MFEIIDFVLLSMLAIATIGVVLIKDLFTVVMLFGVYSLLSALIFLNLDAADVAFTEAAVGAGISTVLILSTLALTGRVEKSNSHKALLSLIVIVVTGMALVYGTLDMPPFGDISNPAHQHVAPRYIDESPVEIGLPNMVTSVLASYRAFDTLGEIVVVFTAVIGVISLLRIPAKDKTAIESGLKSHIVLKVVAKIVIPITFLFALYVQFHGEYGPGGGFQAGVIAAAAVTLYTLVFGLSKATAVIRPNLLKTLTAIGVLIFAFTGLVGLLLGSNFLDYNLLATDPITGQHIGIIVIELGVGITVFSAILNIFYAFAGHAEQANIQ